MHWVGTGPLQAADAVQVFSLEATPLEEQSTGQTVLDNLLTMLADALEVQDLDLAGAGTGEGADEAMKHPVLRIFWKMSHLALAMGALRSEEHTSELQSLMRISYAVFCLKKKKK